VTVAVIHDSAAVLARARKGPRLMLIDGRWVEAVSGKTFDVFDPTVGKVITTVHSESGNHELPPDRPFLGRNRRLVEP
jgi:hypothetical protein